MRIPVRQWRGMQLLRPLSSFRRRDRRTDARNRDARPACAAADYTHFPYADPDAPQDGEITYGVRGTFDSLNPFVVLDAQIQRAAWGDPEYGNLVYESLMQRSRDEPFTMYGLIAETIETDPDRTWAEFTINPECALVRRRADHARGRDLYLRSADREGQAALQPQNGADRKDRENRRSTR
jgi:hypothetical protein